MSYSVKAYWQNPNGDHETRRFHIPNSEDFNYLQRKIKTVFKLDNYKIRINWIDEDQDEIHFTCDEDLEEAKSSMTKQSNPDMLYLTITVDDKTLPTNCHDGIECDECSGPVRGFRYKCLHCDDYDLCMLCESRGTHKVHHMIRIPKKDPRANVTFADLKRTVQHGPNHSQTNTEGSKEEATTTRRNSTTAAPEQSHETRGTRDSRRCRMRQLGRRPGFWHSFAGGDTSGPMPFGRPWGRRRGGHQHQFFHEAVRQEASRVAEDVSTRAMRATTELMQGIWTGWSGFPPGPETPEESCCADPSPPMAAPAPAEKPATATTSEDKTSKPKMAAAYPTNSLFDPALIEMNTEGVKHRCGFTEEPIDEVQPVIEMIEVIDLSKQDGPEEQTQVMETDDNSENVSVADGWNLVYDNGSMNSSEGAIGGVSVGVQSPPKAATPVVQVQLAPQKEPDTTNSASGPPSSEPIPTYLSQRIQWALNQMKMMGYTDEGGLLTRLLQEKEGNINETLDALMAGKI